MKINIDKDLVELSPENANERAELVALWRLVEDCARFNKKLVPVGEYLPDHNKFARFAIEGYEAGGVDDFAEVYVENDCTCFCQTCNKYVNLKKTDRIPPCCGKLMEIID